MIDNKPQSGSWKIDIISKADDIACPLQALYFSKPK